MPCCAGIAMWRRIKRTGRAFSVESERIAEISAADRDAHGSRECVQRRVSATQPRASRRRAPELDVQLQAIREARHTMRRLLWFLPGV